MHLEFVAVCALISGPLPLEIIVGTYVHGIFVEMVKLKLEDRRMIQLVIIRQKQFYPIGRV